LEDVVVSNLQLTDPDDAANTTEKVTLDYAKMTLTDTSTNGTVVVTR
jgi:hypothetical protein